MIASTEPPAAWPKNWRTLPAWVRTYHVLHWHYGQERTAKIVHGYDQPTTQDVLTWRRLGSR